MFATQSADEPTKDHLTYQQSWQFLQAFRPFSAHLNPDGAGDHADISCGDPWYRSVKNGEPGSSLIVVRTERGRRVLRAAMGAGYLELTPSDSGKLIKSQHNLVVKRRAIWGRRFAFKLFGLPLTKLRGLPLFRLWFGLPIADKIKSISGTVRRIVKRRLYQRVAV